MRFLIKSPRGTRDIFLEDSHRWEYVFNVLVEQAKLFGFTKVRTPAFEYAELYSRSSGTHSDVVQKEMYIFKDRSGRELALRPEGTAGVARALIESGILAKWPAPCKLFYILPCYRYEKPQSCRYREFFQFGVEVFGSPFCYADAELILLANSIFSKFGISNSIKLKINSIGCRECRKNYIDAITVFFEKNKQDLCETCNERLNANPMRILDCKNENCIKITKNAPSILDFICDYCRNQFEDLQSLLKSLDVSFSVDNTIVRGLDYYTGTVFEFLFESSSGRSFTICGGGRYNELVSQLGGSPTPALGFGIGIERLLYALDDRNIHIKKDSGPDVYIAYPNSDAIGYCLNLVKVLTSHGISTITNLTSRTLGSQIKEANKKNVKLLIVIGEKEIRENCFSVKNLFTKKNSDVCFDDSFCENIKRLASEN